MKDYLQEFLHCAVDDQKLLAMFEVDTGPYVREQLGYRKRTEAVKLKVKQPLVEERLQFIARLTIEN